MTCGLFEQDHDTQTWKRYVKATKGSLTKLYKVGRLTIKQHKLNANNSFQENRLVEMFLRADRCLWALLANYCINYLTPEAEPYKELLRHIHFKSDHLDCESIIAKLQKDIQNYQTANKKQVKERDDLKEKTKESTYQFENQDKENRKSQLALESQNSNIQNLEHHNSKLKTELQVLQNKEEQYQNTIEQLQVNHEYYVKLHEKTLDERLKQNTILENYREALATQEKLISDLKQQLAATKQEVLELCLNTQDQTHDVQIEQQTLTRQKSTTSELPVYLDRKNSEFRSQIQELEQKLDKEQQFWKDDQAKTAHLHHQEKEKYETEIQLSRNYVITLQKKLDETLEENRRLSAKILTQNQDTTILVNELEAPNFDATKSAKTQLDEIQDPFIRKSLGKISEVREDVLRLKTEVERFEGSKEDRVFLHLNELLIRKIIILDNVETEGHFIIRQKRRHVIELIQSLMDILKSKTK